jgi:hypothetical protein
MGGYRWQHGFVVDGSACGSQQLIDGPRLEGKKRSPPLHRNSMKFFAIKRFTFGKVLQVEMFPQLLYRSHFKDATFQTIFGAQLK